MPFNTELLNPASVTPLARLAAAARKLRRPVQIIEIGGTLGMLAARKNLNGSMPANLSIASALTCGVCVTGRGDIGQLIRLIDDRNLTLCVYEELLRIADPDGKNLESAKQRGADVRIISSAMEVLDLAAREPQRQFVFAASGFDTATPHTAVMILEAHRLSLTNLSVFVMHRLLSPAVLALLGSGVKCDGLLVGAGAAVIIGANSFRRAVSRYAIPCVVSGIDELQAIEALAVCCEMILKRDARLVNLAPLAITDWGNRRAQNLIHAVFTNGESVWRGLGHVPHSGQVLRRQFRDFDARVRFNLPPLEYPDDSTCRCGDVITARCPPGECALFGAGCNPGIPLGPCMAAQEGPCRAWHDLAARA